MKQLLSGIALTALLAAGSPAWSQTIPNEPGYNFPHPTADADNVTVKAETKYDGMSKPNTSALASQAIAGQNNSVMTIRKLKQDLQQAGLTDVKVLDETFVVQAKTKEGNPILLTLGSNGMSFLEAVSPMASRSASSTDQSKIKQAQNSQGMLTLGD